MGAKLYRFLSVVLTLVIYAVVFTGCGPTLFGLEDDETETPQPTALRYGYVKTKTDLWFICKPVDELTSHIYFESVFVNTSTEYIISATVTVEFIDSGKYTLYSYEYEVLADFKVVIKNIPAGESKKFSKMMDISVEKPEDNLYTLYTATAPTTEISQSGLWGLSVFVYKIEYVVGEARPAYDEIARNYNFV
ncbi:MAG: hypothetical protein LBQ05_00430 [Christensenellaceae bacterium]|jgi:hypothetical protein|nr:hypothetical protein [Christensenellaceae bacterium]